MNGTLVTLLHQLRQLCQKHDDEEIWHLATTHSSAKPRPTAQLALSQLGKLGLEFILAWHHARTQAVRDSGTLSKHIAAFMSSHVWVDALICQETSSLFAIDNKLHIAQMTLDTRKTIACAALGAGFYSNSVDGLELTLAALGSYYSSIADSADEHPKTLLQTFAQRIAGTQPKYQVVSAKGPEHSPLFTVRVAISGTHYMAEGHGGSKQAAELDAASVLMRTCNVAPAQPVQRETYCLPPRRLDKRGITTWREATQKNTKTSLRLRPHQIQPFLAFFKTQTTVDLPQDIAEIVVCHLSTAHNPLDLLASQQSGLGSVGTRAYLYALASVLFRDLDKSRLSEGQLPALISGIISTLGAHGYKAGLANSWAPFVQCDKKQFLSLPESVLLGVFDRSLGAAILIDLANLELVMDYLRRLVSEDVDYDAMTPTTGVSQTVRNTAKTAIQSLSQRFLREAPQYGGGRWTTFQSTGPLHSAQYTCHVKGDQKKLFAGVGTTKAAADRETCDKVLTFIYSHVFTNNEQARSSGVVWIDSIVTSMRRSLLDDPDESAWIAMQPETAALPHRDLFMVMKSAIRNPLEASNAALRAIQDNSELSTVQKERLARFIQARFAERSAAEPIRVVENALNRLLLERSRVEPAHVISVLCSCLHLLKCLDRHSRDWVTLPTVVVSALSQLSPVVDTQIAVPAKLASVDVNVYNTVLQQCRSCFGESCGVSIEVEADAIRILGNLTVADLSDHKPLFVSTCALCNVSGCGFTISRTAIGFAIDIPLRKDVFVTKEGVCADNADAMSVLRSGQAIAMSSQVEAVRSALHDIKNRIIASPALWKDELRGCATNLTKIAEVLRAPHLERVSLESIHEVIKTAAGIANKTFITEGAVDVIHEEEVGYVDLAMVNSIISNLIDNAARVAGSMSEGKWHIEGVITSSDIDVSVVNTCADPEGARDMINSGGTRANNVFSTGIGIATVKRLAGKLMGTIFFEYGVRQVCAKLRLPVDLARVSWLLECD